jgi:hypothetical protein
MRIPIKRYVMDESLSWEERYRKLEAHHEEETKFLIRHANKTEQTLGNLLARIHRDGGHYIEEHGMDKAVTDADAKIVRWLSRDDECEDS